MKACKTILTSGLILAGLLGIFGTDLSLAGNKQETTQSEQYQKRREEIIRFDNGKISGIKTFLDDKLMNEKYWSIDGIHTVDIDYKYSKNNNTYEKISYTTDAPQKNVKDRELLRGLPEGKSACLRKWFYDSKTYQLLTSEQYKEGTEIVEKLDAYDKEEKLEKIYTYHYAKGKEDKKRVKGFDCYDAQGKKIGSYNEDTNLNIEDIILSKDISSEQAKELLKVYNGKRTPVVIIDSGFDVNHSSLTHKVWKNPGDPLNGQDDDNNGWTDDVMGWNRHKNGMLEIDIDLPNINEVIVLRNHEPPLSHGTHVASIALKNLDSFALIGFAGDMTNYEYLGKISKFLKEHNILFANMSFGFGNIYDAFAPKSESFDALEGLIKNNPQTLFFVAAGNDSRDLDNSVPSFPPSFPYKNIMVIGALDTDDLLEHKLNSYRPADFSNIGVETVDVFAPGTDVEGALIGGGNIRKSGTSMASPYSLNLALKIYEENPNLKPMEIKEIILKTAYVNLDKTLPCVSKGMIHPSKALEVAKMLKGNPSLTVEEAIVKVYTTY